MSKLMKIRSQILHLSRALALRLIALSAATCLSTAASQFSANFGQDASTNEVSIPDAGLNAAVREALGKAVGALTRQDLVALTNLDAPSRNISDLTGLEAAVNLSSLNLRSN